MGKLYHSSIVWWHECDSDPPIDIWSRWESWPWGLKSRKAAPVPYQLQHLGRTGHAPRLGRTLELTLLVEGEPGPKLWARTSVSITHLSSGGMDGGETPHTRCPSCLRQGGELALSLIVCRTQESSPYTSLSLESVCVGEPTLRMWKQIWPCPLHITARGD